MKNKRGKLILSDSLRISTCTLKLMKEKLSENNNDVSFGRILSLRPFFITFATEKIIALCLCKICFNARLLFDPLVAQAIKDQNDVSDSITKFFMHNYKCPKSENGYYLWKCVAGKCSKCKLIKPRPFECASSEQKIKISHLKLLKLLTKKLLMGKKWIKFREKQGVYHDLSSKMSI